jgi:hypothetical protein
LCAYWPTAKSWKRLPGWTVITILVLGILISGYETWKKEAVKTLYPTFKVNFAPPMITELKNEKGIGTFISMAIVNQSGPPSGFYRIAAFLRLQSGREFEGHLMPKTHTTLIVTEKSGNQVVYAPDEYLYQKALQKISPGSGISGWALYKFDISYDDLLKENCADIVLKFDDIVSEKTHEYTNTFCPSTPATPLVPINTEDFYKALK